MHLVRRLPLLGLALLLFAAAPALAAPALWVAHKADSTVYLFGTVHLLPGRTTWRFPALNKALQSSRALYVEEDDDNPLQMQALVLRYGLDFEHPLSDKLDKANQALLTQAAITAGLPNGVSTLQPMRPWLAAVTLTVTPLIKAGMDPKKGVDRQLRAQMKQAGKPIHGFETAAEQIRYLANLSPEVQLDFLRATLKDFQNAQQELKTLVATWQAGDVEKLGRIADLQMRDESPQLYQRLIVHRNKGFAKQIEGLLDKPGTRFVALGAAHLAGPDSVQKQLARQGIRVERTQP